MINQLGEAMDTGAERTALMKILNSLAGYTKTHFSDEERLMTEHGYPELEAHKEEHVALNRQLAEFYRDFFLTSRPQTAEVMAFLQGWLYNHIIARDKLYMPFLGE